MPNFAGTQAETYFRAATGSAPGILEFTYTLNSTVYVNAGTVSIAGLSAPLDSGLQVVSIQFSIESSAAAYMPVFTPAANPTLGALGTLSLFTTTGTHANGNLTCVVRGRALLCGPSGVLANIAG
jgi:hypothetical protein